MRRPVDHFSTDVDQSEAEALRALLENTEPADLLDKRACERVGMTIARAATLPDAKR